jgi:hypothetical protein
MHDRGGSPQGFALFDTPAHAWGALELITQLQFDSNVHLRCEMAHKDMYLKVLFLFFLGRRFASGHTLYIKAACPGQVRFHLYSLFSIHDHSSLLRSCNHQDLQAFCVSEWHYY